MPDATDGHQSRPEPTPQVPQTSRIAGVFQRYRTRGTLIILKLAEFVSKNYRLDTGQATENIAHAIGPSLDFSKLSQTERDQWRALAVKGGGGE